VIRVVDHLALSRPLPGESSSTTAPSSPAPPSTSGRIAAASSSSVPSANSAGIARVVPPVGQPTGTRAGMECQSRSAPMQYLGLPALYYTM